MNMVKKFGNGLVNKLNKMNIKDVTDKFLNVTSFNYNFQLRVYDKLLWYQNNKIPFMFYIYTDIE